MRILLALIVLTLAVSPLSASQADEESAIREIQARWDDAWNRNDVKALSSLVTEDVRFVNVAGQVLTGRGEFEQLQTRTHAMQFKESVRTVTGTEIKFFSAASQWRHDAGAHEARRQVGRSSRTEHQHQMSSSRCKFSIPSRGCHRAIRRQ